MRLTGALLLVSLLAVPVGAGAQSLEALDAAPPPSPLAMAWEEPVRASLVRRGGNGPGRVQYAIPSDPHAIGAYVADAVTYEYIDKKLGTVLAMFKSRYDAEGVQKDLIALYGPPTYQDPTVLVWRGARVRVVWRQQAMDLWTVSWSWLALHGGEDAETP